MASEFGNRLKVSVFGQSHGAAIGVLVNGFPAGTHVDMEELQSFLARRAPGNSPLSTSRKEADTPEFLSGIVDNTICDAPLCAIIRNSDMRSGDYSALENKPRPSHADYPAMVKYGGYEDLRGGGHFSGRLTAPLCIAGGIAKQVLARRGIYIGAHIYSVGTVEDQPLEPVALLAEALMLPANKRFPVIDDAAGERMQMEIRLAARDQDSLGGTIECGIVGLPAGLGNPMFDGIENRLSQALFGIPALKGLSFGAGFEAAKMRGSAHNDPYTIENGTIRTATNHHGGILGGITTGMPILFKCAFKPTPSIGQPQQTVDLKNKKNVSISISGRHDPCIAPRAVPVVEAVAALVILDLLLEEEGNLYGYEKL